jgi:hypothetical protein
MSIQCMKAEEVYVNEDILKSVFQHVPKEIKSDKDLIIGNQSRERQLIESVYDWYYVYCNNTAHSKFNFYLGGLYIFYYRIGSLSLFYISGLGGLDVVKLDGKSWIRVHGISLPEGTLIYAEDVEEQRGEGRGIHKSHSLHIIDAFSLGMDPIFKYCMKWRYEFVALKCIELPCIFS